MMMRRTGRRLQNPSRSLLFDTVPDVRFHDSAFGWLRIADDIEADFELIAQSQKNIPSKLVKSSYLTEHQCHFVVFETRKHDGSDREHVIAGLCYLLTKKKRRKMSKMRIETRSGRSGLSGGAISSCSSADASQNLRGDA